MQSRTITRLGLPILLVALLAQELRAQGYDVTRLVRETTDAEARIAAACSRHCQGNRRKGWLQSVRVEPLEDPDLFRVHGEARLRNWHVTKGAIRLRIYDRTVVVEAVGLLRRSTCELVVESARVVNDYENLFTSLLRRGGGVIGRRETIPDCNRFLPARTDG